MSYPINTSQSSESNIIIAKCIAAARETGSTIKNEEIVKIVNFALTKIKEGVQNQYYKADTLEGNPLPRSIDILENGKFIIHLNKTKSKISEISDPENQYFTKLAEPGIGSSDKILGSGFNKIAKFSIDSEGNILVRCTAKDDQALENEIARTQKLGQLLGKTVAKLVHVSRFLSKKGEPKAELIFQFYRGGDVEKQLSSLNIKDRVKIGRSLVAFIKDAHSNGYTHGDLFLRNIFLDPNIGVIISDFGNARDTNDKYFEDYLQYDIEKLALALRALFANTQYSGDIYNDTDDMISAKQPIEHYAHSLEYLLKWIENNSSKGS